MIKSFRHKGLARFYLAGSTWGIQPGHANRLRMLLAALDSASSVLDLNKPGYFLHRLKGRNSQTWSIRVSGNWRLTFAFKEGNVYLLKYEDYH